VRDAPGADTSASRLWIHPETGRFWHHAAIRAQVPRGLWLAGRDGPDHRETGRAGRAGCATRRQLWSTRPLRLTHESRSARRYHIVTKQAQPGSRSRLSERTTRGHVGLVQARTSPGLTGRVANLRRYDCGSSNSEVWCGVIGTLAFRGQAGLAPRAVTAVEPRRADRTRTVVRAPSRGRPACPSRGSAEVA
jgi:hypothetical protein